MPHRWRLGRTNHQPASGLRNDITTTIMSCNEAVMNHLPGDKKFWSSNGATINSPV